MAKKMTAQQYGHWFQGVVQKALDELMQKGPWFYQRLYDTASAAGFLPKQPADFIGTSNGTAFILEVKASRKYVQFDQPGALRSLLKDHQALACRLQDRAGGKGLVIFRSDQGMIELWDGAVVREIYITPRAQLSRTDGLLAMVVEESDKDRDVVDAVKGVLTTYFDTLEAE